MDHNPTALTPDEVEALLERLCVDLGFCLPSQAQEQLIESSPNDVERFANAVFIAEGMNPLTARRDLYKQVFDTIAVAFAQASTTATRNSSFT